MKRFAALLDRLTFESARLAKLRLLEEYFRTTPDPDRGWALAALSGALFFEHAKPSLARDLVESRVDGLLFELSWEYVGDLAETVALIWPAPESSHDSPSLAEVVHALREADRKGVPELLASLLDRLDANGRWALIKLLTSNLRVGVSGRMAKMALSSLGSKPIDAIEEVWYSQTPPYEGLFAWLENRVERPVLGATATFRPPMLAHPIEREELETLHPGDFSAEWKWDGIRVQRVSAGGVTRLFSRSGEDITASFPELIEPSDATLDGELLIVESGETLPFGELQRRLNRKKLGPALLKELPAFIRLYDILFEGEEDLRALPFAERRARLERWFAQKPRARMDLSPLVPFESWDELESKRASYTSSSVEGVMLKRNDSPYVAGRPKGLWFKWKRDALLVDAVLLYAQRGTGKRSSYYSDYTFGVWTAGGELVPVGKAYSGFTDEELKTLDRWIRNHTTQRFGPVREVEKSLVVEVAFEGLWRSNRHKSGLAMRFPRIHRIRWDKPASEADTLATMMELLDFLEQQS